MATAVKEEKVLDAERARIEAWLEEHNVTEFEFKQRVSFTAIDKEASLHNQARFRALDDDRVLLIGEAMEQHPTKVPPLVLYQLPRKKTPNLQMVDGNHRMGGAELLDLKGWPAYVITEKLSETQLRLLTFTANLDHGLPTGIEERISQAIWLVEERSTSQEQAAKLMQVPVKRLGQKLSAIRARRRLDEIGVDSGKVGVSNSKRLDALKSDEVLKAAATLIIEAKMRTDEASNFIAKLNVLRGEKQQIDLIDRERKARKPAVDATVGGKVALPPVIRRVQSVIASVNRIDVAELRDARVDEMVKRQLKSRATEATRRLAAVIESL